MGISNEQKKDILKRIFITGELWNFESAKKLSSEEKEYRNQQIKTDRRFNKIKRQYGTSKECGIFQFENTVYNTLVSSVMNRALELPNARKDANHAFKVYMEYKKLVRSGELSYADEKVRKNFNELKANWIKASQKVQRIKCLLKQDEVLLNKFMEFMKLI